MGAVKGRVREQAVPVVRVVQAARPVRCGRPLVTTSMWQRGGGRDAPVNNLMVRSQSACSFRVLELPVPAEGRWAGRVFMAFP